MARNEKQTRIDLIDPALFERGWTHSLIRMEKTPGGTDIAVEALPGALLREIFDFEKE